MNDEGGEGGKQEEMKTRCQMGLTCSRKIIENSSNVLGITRGRLNKKFWAPRSE